MTAQTDNGRAFEWAIGSTVSDMTGFTIASNKFSVLAKKSFLTMTSKKQSEFIKAAIEAVGHILKKENKSLDIKSSGTIEFNTDAAGQKGDVRDILIHAKNITIGISCKTNHQALKHSRLSGKVDFVQKWGLDINGCSAHYWSQVKPIFSDLAQIRKSSNRTALWEEITDKPDKYYWPLLELWADEIQRLCKTSDKKSQEVCQGIISYLIGKHDFYKVICLGSKRVEVQGYNFNGTLATKKTNYPDCINAINNKNGGVYSKTIVFNHGFSINFRIHNASSRVEPSLKFDITAIGLPPNEVYQQTFDL